MEGIPYSCRLCHNILNKDKPPTCAKSCFEPSGEPCADYKIQTVVDCPPSTVSNFLEPDSPVRRSRRLAPFVLSPKIIIHIIYAHRSADHSAQGSIQKRQRTPPKRDFKHSCILSDGTEVGRIFETKFRIRRQSPDCSNCKKELLLRETVTGSNDVVLLSNCCDVQIYPERKMVNWHVVPVKMISEQEKISKQVLCVTYPPPPPKKVEVVVEKDVKIGVTVVEIMDKKKNKKKGKGKGKKGGKTKKK